MKLTIKLTSWEKNQRTKSLKLRWKDPSFTLKILFLASKYFLVCNRCEIISREKGTHSFLVGRLFMPTRFEENEREISEWTAEWVIRIRSFLCNFFCSSVHSFLSLQHVFCSVLLLSDARWRAHKLSKSFDSQWTLK